MYGKCFALNIEKDTCLSCMLLQATSPAELQEKVGAVLTDATCTRGVNALQQVRRSYIKVLKDDKGRDMIRVRGYVNTKNNQGRGVDYQPLDKTIYGGYEVRLFKYFGVYFELY